MSFNNVEVESIHDYKILIQNRLKEHKMPDKVKTLIIDLMLDSFRVGGEVAINKKSKVKM